MTTMWDVATRVRSRALSAAAMARPRPSSARRGRVDHAGATVAVAVLLLAGAVHGQQEDLRRYELGEVVVSATRGAGVESISTVRTVSRPELEASGVASLDEALRLVPGLQVRTGGAGTPRVDVRGFRTRHVLLLVDGVPVNDTFDGQVDPTTIPVEHIERIKVTTGGGSLLYGPGGNGGVINVITRSGGGDVAGSLAATGGEADAYGASATASGGSGPWSGFVSADSRTSDGYPLASDFAATPAQAGGRRDNSDRQRQTLFASGRYTPSEHTRIGLTANHLWGEGGVPPVTNEDKNDPFSQKTKYDRQDDLQGYAVQAAFDHDVSPDLGLRGWAYLTQQEAEDNRYDDDTYSTQSARGAQHTTSSTRIAGASLQVRRRVAAAGLATVGLLLEEHGWEALGFAIDKSGSVDVDASESLQILSTALQVEAWPRPGLALAAGLAYHRQLRDVGDDGDVAGLLGASYQLTGATRVKASWARKVRFPSIRQLYDVDAGNPDLAAERTVHLEAGLEQQLPASVVLSVVAFATEATGFIEKDDSDRYRNFEDLRLRGLEVSGVGRVLYGTRMRGGYTFLHSEDRSVDSGRDALQHRPRHTLALQLTHPLRQGLTPYLSVLRVADQVFYDNDKTPPLEQKSLQDYTVVDLRLAQRLAAGRAEAHVAVDNLFDEDYEESYGLPQPGRRFHGGLRYAF